MTPFFYWPNNLFTIISRADRSQVLTQYDRHYYRILESVPYCVAYADADAVDANLWIYFCIFLNRSINTNFLSDLFLTTKGDISDHLRLCYIWFIVLIAYTCLYVNHLNLSWAMREALRIVIILVRALYSTARRNHIADGFLKLFKRILSRNRHQYYYIRISKATLMSYVNITVTSQAPHW